MSEPMDIDINHDSRDRDASPRRDRPEVRARSPRGYSGEDYKSARGSGGYRESRDFRGGGGGGGYRESRDYRDTSYRSGPGRGSKSDRNYSNSIFVGNIPYHCDSEDLKKHFEKAGHVVRADIVTQNGRHRGMATVEFSSKEEVHRAISEFDHSNFMHRDIFVRQDNPPPEERGTRGYGRDNRGSRGDYSRGDDRFGGRRDDRYGGRDRGFDRFDRRDDRGSYGRRDDHRRDDRPPPLPRNGPVFEVFVGNLPFSVNWQALKDMFRECGTVTRADVKLDDRGRSKGYGIVSYDSASSVQAAIQKFHGFVIEGRTIDVREGKRNSSSEAGETDVHATKINSESKLSNDFTSNVTGNGEKSCTIFADNLPFATSNEDLQDLFEPMGSLVRAEIIFGSDDRPAGKAVVQFRDEEGAAGAIERLDGYEYGDRQLKISYALRN